MDSSRSIENFIFKFMLLLPLYQYMSLSEVDNNILSESLTGDGDHFNNFSGKKNWNIDVPFLV